MSNTDQNVSLNETTNQSLNESNLNNTSIRKEEEHQTTGTTSTSTHNSQDRKRKNDSDTNNSSYKRSNMSRDENDVFFKLLVPSSVAGSVIGRGGERIAQIQKDANVRIKMSKATEYYPNTNERVCLIIGSVRAVLKAHDLIVEKIQEKPETSKQHESELYERVNQIKLLVPNSTAGLIIGKGGAFIKQIKDDSGAFVQISSKLTDLPERIVTIEGDIEKRTKALSLVIRKIADDPLHNTVTTLNYSNMSSGSNSSSQNVDQYGGNAGGNVLAQANQPKLDFNSIANYLAGLNNLALLIMNCGGSFQMTADSLKVSLRNAGYSSSASMEIIDAITVLLSYGLITKTSPAALIASNPAVAGLGNMANLTSVIAASMVSTMANMANNANSNQINNLLNNASGGGGGSHDRYGSQYYSHGHSHGHMNGNMHSQNGHHSSSKH